MPVVYLTTNKINNKKYIGADKNNNPNYFGSGLKIKLAIKKYGRENFTKEIIEECELDNLYEREKYWVDFYDCVNSDDYYNLSEGGKGGNKLYNKQSHKKWEMNRPNISKYAIERKGKTYKEIYGDNAEIEKNKRRNSLLGVKHSTERRKKQSESHLNKIPWNKGLTKNDIRIKNFIKQRKSPTYIKTYILITPENQILEFNGKHKLKEYIKKVNEKFNRKLRINVDRVIREGNSKNYLITIKQ